MDYIAEIIVAINRLHGCAAVHRATVPVKEVFQGKTVWDGEVEVFDLANHPKAKKAYAWGYPNGKGGLEVVAVLEIPPVDSALTAVRAAIVQASRN